MPNGLAGSAQVSYPLQAPSGTAGAPSYSFAASPTTGMYRVGGTAIGFSSNGVGVLYQDAQTTQLASGGALAWSSGVIGAASDVILWRDAANVLALKNSTNAQEFRVYGTTTGSKYVALGCDGPHSYLVTSAPYLALGNANGEGWLIYGTPGDFIPYTTGSRDVGNVSTRVRTIFLGGNTPAVSTPMLDLSQTWNDAGVAFIGISGNAIDMASAAGSYWIVLQQSSGTVFSVGKAGAVYGTTFASANHYEAGDSGVFYWTTRSVLASPSNGVITISNRAVTDFTRLCFGGTTAAFPAIARDGANLSLVHADGSAGYIDLTVHDVIGSSVYLSNLVGVGANNTNIGLSLTGFAMNIHNSAAALTLAVTGGATLATFAGTGYLEMYEVTAPSAPAANTGRIYFEDNGAGKTRLMCLFGSGAAQQLAIEP